MFVPVTLSAPVVRLMLVDVVVPAAYAAEAAMDACRVVLSITGATEFLAAVRNPLETGSCVPRLAA